MIKNRILSIVATSLLLAGSVVGCSDDTDESGGTGGSAGGDTGGSGGGDTGGSGGGDTGGTGGSGGGDTGGTGGGGGETCQTIVEIATTNPDFELLAEAVVKAGLAGALTDVTVFAPTDDAFEALLGSLPKITDGMTERSPTIADLTVEQLTPILTYHVVDGEVPSSVAVTLTEADTLGGEIALGVTDGKLYIDPDEANAEVVTPDVAACDGLIHIIDKVLLPSVADIATSQADYSELATLVTSATSSTTILNALETTENITLFAPTNSAITGLASAPSADDLDSILQYHVYAGDSPASPIYSGVALGLDSTGVDLTMLASGDVNVATDDGTVVLTDFTDATSDVTVVDIFASRGSVIHRIDGVLVPELP
ncbi:MAG: fasciclin domain-containing protein [Polyangiaceae bacterium]|nr:fasciclin domain-containing protein [Polyangiaceae bacterium]